MEITRRNPAVDKGGRGAAKGVAGCRLDYEPGLLAA